MKQQKIKQVAGSLLRESFRTTHDRIVTCGLLLVVLGYLPFRLGEMLLKALQGSASILMMGVVCLGGYQLWQQRHHLTKLKASDEDRLLGYVLIGGGVVLFPVCLFSIWSQTFISLVILAGVACSCWGLIFFRTYLLPALLICLGLLPNPGVVAQAFWETLTPPLMLERFTAWIALWALRAIGQPVSLQDTIIQLPGGAVHITWGCTGFNMALSVAVAGLLMGLFFKESPRKTLMLIAAGILLALLINIPRLVLLSMAEAYWGKSSFHFWHDGWGAQIVSGTLFTVYYYVAMALLKQRPAKSSPT
jgi:exosortase